MTSPFGAGLRRWRNARHMSQLALATKADVSQRHVSFLETGRARPSREMVIHLAEVLEVPLRDRNTLLESAGFASAYTETRMGEPAMAEIEDVLDFIMDAHEPFPALVVDRHWNVVKSNNAATRLTLALVDPTRAPVDGGVVNLARLALHPQGVRPNTVNFDDVARSLLQRLRRDLDERPFDEDLQALWDEVSNYEGLPEPGPKVAATGEDLLLPVHYRIGDIHIRLMSTIATIGAPHDVTVEELRIETLLPADAASDATLRSLDSD